MRKVETLLAGLLWFGAAILLPMAAFEPVSIAAACADGSAHLAMGCASIQL
jgi:hypothetical protein